MRATILPVALFAALAMGVSAASAASPGYCALFAKKFVELAAKDGQTPPSQLMRDRAYHKCLNLDNEPPLPSAYTDPATDGNGRPFIIDDGSATAVVDETITNPPAIADPAAQSSAPAAPAVEETAVLQAEPQPDAEATAKPQRALRSWMSGFVGKFRRAPSPSSSPPSSPSPPPVREASVTGDWGRTMTAAERAAWCAEHFPRSYDPTTGTVIPYKTGIRTKC